VSRAAQLPNRNNFFWGNRQVVPEGGEQGSSNAGVVVEYNEVAPDYFTTLGVPLLRGREFTVRDTASAPRVVIVNETLARRLWPGEDPLGKRLRFGGMGLGPFHAVVGVARDLRKFFREEKPPPQVYLALDQSQTTDAPLLVRLQDGGRAIAALIQNEQRQLDPGLPPATIESFRAVLAGCMPSWPACSAAWRWHSRRSDSTACWPMPWLSAPARSACGWPSARNRATCCGS
jgi:hypothetical protein